MVIATRDRPAFLEELLLTLRRSLPSEHEVLVVDSASRGSETRRVARAAEVAVMRCDRPGASRARNAGWRSTEAPVIAFTDDDCLPHSGWTQAFEDAFSDPGVGFAFGRVRPDRADGPTVSVFERSEPYEVTSDDPRPLGHGANMSFRRATLEQLGGFDEVLGAGAPLRSSEDKDAFWRALRAGWKGRYVPEAIVSHRQWRGRKQVLATSLSYGVGEGALATKVARLGEGRGGSPWDIGFLAQLRQAARDLVNGYQMGAAMSLCRAAGCLAGSVRARRLELSGEIYRS